MKKLYRAVFVALVLLTSVNAIAQEIKIDSLVLRHNKKGETEIIKKFGHKIFIKTKDGQKHFGRFLYHTNVHLIISQNDKIKNILIDDISAIKRRHNVVSGITSMLTTGTGYAATALGISSSVGGLALSEDNPAAGYSLVVLSVPLLYYGVKWIVVGYRTTKTFSMKKWEIVQTNY